MDFITIDFETANEKRNSPCQIGLTFVEGGSIKETLCWFIKPKDNYFHFFNTKIHGITASDVDDKPEFDELWEEIKPLIDGKFLIAHFAGFDMNVLIETLDLYGLEYPAFKSACTYIIAKKVWKYLPGYDLKTLCAINEIDFEHHNAGEDSRAAAELALLAFEAAGIESPEDIPEKLKINLGGNIEGKFNPSRSQKLFTKSLDELQGNPDLHNPDSIFYDKKVVFTGALGSMIRNEAMQFVLDIGGKIGKNVARDTDFLIVGQQDYRVVGEDGMSSKQEKAIKLIESGYELEILSEDDFLRNI